MSETPLVSICCITYNHASFIRQCLDGFLMQKTSFPFEILIHDDASTDGTADIIREYQAKYPEIIKPILQKENQYSKGVSITSLNYERACGKYIAVCEGDDYWTDPEKLQIQFDYMEKHPECSLCFHPLKILKDGIFTDAFLYGEKEFDFSFGKEKMPHCPTCSLFFQNIDHSRELCEVLRKGSTLIKGGDLFVVGVMSHFGKLHYMPRIMGVYRNHPGGITKNKKWLGDEVRWITQWLYFEDIVPEAHAAMRENLHRKIKDELFRLLCLKQNITLEIIKKIYCYKGLKCVIYLYVTSILSAMKNFPRFLFRKIVRFK